jgi:hypothetical protein
MRVNYRICSRSAKDFVEPSHITGAVSTDEEMSQAKTSVSRNHP